MQAIERFAHAGIERRRVQHVLAIIVQEKIAAPSACSSSVRSGSARRTSIGAPLPTYDATSRGAAARRCFQARMALTESDQISLGIDQRSVEIENEKIAAFFALPAHAFPFRPLSRAEFLIVGRVLLVLVRLAVLHRTRIQFLTGLLKLLVPQSGGFPASLSRNASLMPSGASCEIAFDASMA